MSGTQRCRSMYGSISQTDNLRNNAAAFVLDHSHLFVGLTEEDLDAMFSRYGATDCATLCTFPALLNVVLYVHRPGLSTLRFQHSGSSGGQIHIAYLKESHYCSLRYIGDNSCKAANVRDSEFIISPSTHCNICRSIFLKISCNRN